VDKEELIKFSKSSASGAGSGNFLKHSSTLQDEKFLHNFAYFPGKLVGSSWKFYQGNSC